MDIYLILFLLITLIGAIVVYIYYLQEKKEQLDSIRRGFCPQCKQNDIERTDQRSGGCSGTQMIRFECHSCGYANHFSLYESNHCGS